LENVKTRSRYKRKETVFTSMVHATHGSAHVRA